MLVYVKSGEMLWSGTTVESNNCRTFILHMPIHHQDRFAEACVKSSKPEAGSEFDCYR